MGRRQWLSWLAMVLMLALGCGSNTCTVSGTVTFDGQLVPDGDIILNDADGRLAPDYGKIKDGKFTFLAKPGKKTVEIRAAREVPEKRTPMGPYHEDYIPRRYNSQTTLKEEVIRGGKNQFEFKLESNKN